MSTPKGNSEAGYVPWRYISSHPVVSYVGDLPVYGADHASKMAGANFVACVTAPLRQQVLDRVGLPAERTGVVWMGVDTDTFRDEGR